MIIDCHNHVLGTALPPGHERFLREMRGPRLRAEGLLPDDRPASEEDWQALDVDLAAPVDPVRLITDHRAAGVDRAVVLAVAPSDYTAYGQRGTVDLAGVTDVDGPLSIDRSNDYIAALTRAHPELIGVAAVNPRYRGPDAACAELERAVRELGLAAVKLYPMYDQYRLDDPELALPVLSCARDLGIGVMVHMGTTPARDAPLALGHPLVVDEVARRFPDLPLLICHAGDPWVEDCLAVVARHDHVYVDVSYCSGDWSRRDAFAFVQRVRRAGCPLSRICWGTDYPGGGRPTTLLPVFALMNDAAGDEQPVAAADLARMLGGNWARFAQLPWDQTQTEEQLPAREPTWRALLGDAGR